MATSVEGDLEQSFPRLESTEYRVTSPQDSRYNCVAWAAGDTKCWWWPDRMKCCHWPRGAPRATTLTAFQRAFEQAGSVVCEDGRAEPGSEKVTIFAKGAAPTHVARQLPTGLWTSKLGRDVDIEHELEAVAGEEYGSVALLMERPL